MNLDNRRVMATRRGRRPTIAINDNNNYHNLADIFGLNGIDDDDDDVVVDDNVDVNADDNEYRRYGTNLGDTYLEDVTVDQYNSRMKLLTSFLEQRGELRDEFLVLQDDDGGPSYVTSMVALFLRAGWSMGTRDRYLHSTEKGQDKYT